MKKILTLISVVLLLCLLCGCNTISSDNEETETTQATTLVMGAEEDLTSLLKIYEESLENNITTYCEEYLTYTGSPKENYEAIQDIITTEYQTKLKSTEGYSPAKNDYEQSTAINKIYYGDFSSPSDTIDVIAQCYQTVIFDNKATTGNVFYVFNMVYNQEHGWLIDSVELPSDTF